MGMVYSGLYQTTGRSLGWSFEDIWTEAVGFMTGDPIGPLVIVLSGLTIAFFAAYVFFGLLKSRT